MPKSPSLKFAQQPRVVLPGSERAALVTTVTAARISQPKVAQAKSAQPKSRLTVSVIIKRKQPLKIGSRPTRVSRARYKKLYAADPAAMQLVKNFAREFNLEVEPDPTAAVRRTMQLTGSIADMQAAFGVTLQHASIDGHSCHVREGAIYLPKLLVGPVEAVLGLDNRPQAQPHFRILRPRATAPTSYTPLQVAAAYQFPANASAAGQTIAIIELGGGYRQPDLTAYFKSLGLAAPSISAIAVDGGSNSPSTASSADAEVMLDIEVSAAVAPGAKIAVYFTPNTDQGFLDAITTAVHDTTHKPSVISISWGGPESSWTAQALASIDAACQSAAALGITITVAVGDNGSSDGASGTNVDFPASSPHVLACGGTKLVASGSTISSEVVWNEQATNEGATGGGVSNVFPLPTWQANANVPAPAKKGGGRGLPDVAGDADPETGYTIRVDGQTIAIGGTSAVAPLWAGLIAVANQQLGTTVGFLQPTIYAAKAAAGFRDITEGNNGAFQAGPGWDACTGLGSPIATKLIPLLASSSSTPTKKRKKKPVAKKRSESRTPFKSKRKLSS